MALTNDDRTHVKHAPGNGRGFRAAAGLTPRWLWVVAAGLFLTALNLRPAISGLGPLLEEVRHGLGMSGTVAGLLTSLPALCFAVFGVTAPRLARRYGPAAVVLAGMAAVALGTALRPLAGGTGVFLATSTLALAGIAVGNVLMPVLVKRYFPDRIGTMTGLYSMALAGGTAAAAALTVPLTQAIGGGWRTGLGVWSVPAVLAALLWVVVLLRERRGRRGTGETHGSVRPGGENGARREPAPRIMRSPTAWALAVFFGLQSTGAYVTLGWMPQIFRDAGVPATTAGVLVAVIMGMGVPLAFVLPRLAAGMRRQGGLLAVLGVSGLAAYAGLWLAPAAGAWLWALLLGVAMCAFPVVLTLIGMRARTGAGVAGLSAFAQSTGYLLSLPGPLIVGLLYDTTGGWDGPLLFMIVLMALQIGIGFLAGRDRCVEDES
ncbi:CynX/NimT family MFS transporter [Streptomyces sodiiphilus]